MIKKTVSQDQNTKHILHTMQNIMFDLCGVLLIKKTAQQLADNPTSQCSMQVVNFLEVISLLRACKAAGHQLFAVSNLSIDAYERIKQEPEIASLFSFFDDIIISSMTPYEKPNPQIFSYVCDQYNVNPKDCIFIDDKEENLEGARSAQISRTILCQNFDLAHIKKQLIAFGALTHNAVAEIDVPTGQA